MHIYHGRYLHSPTCTSPLSSVEHVCALCSSIFIKTGFGTRLASVYDPHFQQPLYLETLGRAGLHRLLAHCWRRAPLLALVIVCYLLDSLFPASGRSRPGLLARPLDLRRLTQQLAAGHHHLRRQGAGRALAARGVARRAWEPRPRTRTCMESSVWSD